MAQGFSGGFFLPAQRSVHCKGGFFATDGAAPQRPQGAASKAAVAATAFYKSTPSSSGNQYASTTTSHNARRRSSRKMNMGDSDDDPSERSTRHHQPDSQHEEKSLRQRGQASSTRFVRPQREKKASARGEEDATSASRLFLPGGRSSQTFLNSSDKSQSSSSLPARDVNAKFELAMQEFNQIKGEYALKQQRQSSAPAIVFAHGSLQDEKMKSHSDLPQSASRKPSSADSSNHQQQSSTTASSNSSQSTTTGTNEPQRPSETKNLNSPRQRLQVAEMVMRKLYRKNLQTEEVAAKLREENAQLVERIQQLEQSATIDGPASTKDVGQIPEVDKFGGAGNQYENEPTVMRFDHKCISCSVNQSLPTSTNIPPIVNPPTLESVNRIDQQQLEYLRHLAAEQDKTITCLKIRIEELSNQLEAVKQVPQPAGASHVGGGERIENGKGGGKATPRQLVNRLQSKLQHALSESERQKSNYIKMKQDFQHLLGLKTKTLVDNPAQLNASARELLQLMEKKLAQIEREHSQNLSVYDSKLYEVEQQTCESYVQKKMMEEEIQRIAQDVQRRDDVDMQIEQCMVGVFERLRQVEMENVLLKATTASTSSSSAAAAAAIHDGQ